MMNIDDQKKKMSKLSQGEMPRSTLKDAVMLAAAIRDDFAGKGATPIDLAKSLGRSPTSSSWRYLTGAAVAYGLVDGGYNAQTISLTSLGKQIVSPVEEGTDKDGLIAAMLRPGILKNFYEKYNGSKFPKEDIAKNVLVGLGVPSDRATEALGIVIDNAKFVGAITDAGNGQYIQLRRGQPLTPISSSGEALISAPEEKAAIIVPKSHPGLTDIEIVKGMVVLSIRPELIVKKKVRTELNALMDAAEALAEVASEELRDS